MAAPRRVLVVASGEPQIVPMESWIDQVSCIFPYLGANIIPSDLQLGFHCTVLTCIILKPIPATKGAFRDSDDAAVMQFAKLGPLNLEKETAACTTLRCMSF